MSVMELRASCGARSPMMQPVLLLHGRDDHVARCEPRCPSSPSRGVDAVASALARHLTEDVERDLVARPHRFSDRVRTVTPCRAACASLPSRERLTAGGTLDAKCSWGYFGGSRIRVCTNTPVAAAIDPRRRRPAGGR
jgi:hypothetical protein